MSTIILASESPRRRHLLSEAGFNFVVLASKVSETPDKNLNVNEQILDIARRKAEGTLTLVEQDRSRFSEPCFILAADTEVVLDGATLGKPETPQHAIDTLKKLSGRPHEVITAIALINSQTKEVFSHIETTYIHFKNLTDEQIQTYVASGDPMDKAGSYGIQSGAKEFIEKMEGSFDNVVGLPVSVVKNLFLKAGVGT